MDGALIDWTGLPGGELIRSGLADATDRDRLLRSMRELGREARQESTIYLTGGASALLFGWRGTTIDVDMIITPESAEIFRALPQLKERYDLNIDLVAPPHFIPELPGWQKRSLHRTRRPVTFRHATIYSATLAKLERGHARDRADVDAMAGARLVSPDKLRESHDVIEPELYRYPAITPAVFRRAVEEYLRG